MRRALALFCGVGLAAFAAAEPNFGTKSDTIASGGASAQGIGPMPFIQMMVALAIVFGIVKYLLPKLAKGLNKKIVANSQGGIRIEETAGFAGGNLYVVTVRNKTLLLSASQSGVTCLADLTDNAELPEKPLFMDILSQETEAPSHLFVQENGDPSNAMRNMLTEEQIQTALDRLSRFAE